MKTILLILFAFTHCSLFSEPCFKKMNREYYSFLKNNLDKVVFDNLVLNHAISSAVFSLSIEDVNDEKQSLEASPEISNSILNIVRKYNGSETEFDSDTIYRGLGDERFQSYLQYKNDFEKLLAFLETLLNEKNEVDGGKSHICSMLALQYYLETGDMRLVDKVVDEAEFHLIDPFGLIVRLEAHPNEHEKVVKLCVSQLLNILHDMEKEFYISKEFDFTDYYGRIRNYETVLGAVLFSLEQEITEVDVRVPHSRSVNWLNKLIFLARTKPFEISGYSPVNNQKIGGRIYDFSSSSILLKANPELAKIGLDLFKGNLKN